MFRTIFAATRAIRPLTSLFIANPARINISNSKAFTTLNRYAIGFPKPEISQGSLSTNKQILELSKYEVNATSVRTVTKFSFKKGKRKTAHAVIRRFMRLHWGGWIRTKVGKNKKIWKKRASNQRRLRQHVFCNSTQSTLLDKMVTKFWKRPKYYVDDPYTPYHTREEYRITRRKPL